MDRRYSNQRPYGHIDPRRSTEVMDAPGGDRGPEEWSWWTLLMCGLVAAGITFTFVGFWA